MKIHFLRLLPLPLCCALLTSPAANAQALLVVNQGDATVSIVDPVQNKVIGRVHEPVEGVHAHEAAVAPDGRTAFVPIYGSTGVGRPGIDGHQMLIIDVPSQKVVGNIDFGHAVRPHQPVVDPRGKLLYVTTELDRSVTVVDLQTRKIVGSIPTGQDESHMLVLSHDGKRGYTANVGPGTVSVLDMNGRKTLGVIHVAGTVQRISISPDDKRVFTADMTAPRLVVIDTGSNKVAASVALPGTAYGTAATPDGRWLLVTIPSTEELAVVDLTSLKVVRRIKVPSKPQEVLIRPDAKVAYVSCNQSGQVAVVDLKDWVVTDTVAAGPVSDGLAWAAK